MPKVSVLMPVWNRAHLVGNAIQSILDQTFEDFEFLIVDDGSTDGTLSIITKFARYDRRIRLLPLMSHKGLVLALEAGNESAKGRIIVKQDSDDVSLPNRLEVINREIGDSEFFYHGMYQTWNDEENELITKRAYIPAQKIKKERILREQYIPGCFAYTRKFIKAVPYRFLNCSEDWMLILDAFFKKRKIGFINEGLYEYFLHVDSNSLVHEGTGDYEEDEKAMKYILESEYKINDFQYAKR